ncbi:hypothetical protein PI124_g18966 [Phytophthora idaei]|nr:hypothetical protein PI125_g20518 [Phytophthora idaei]KAG3135354.1 hypothetical protein PI126_g18289 [Phytophthora idaei]KAG3236015.1 hypothetical protein PI124_g18966 [Phytophthora idaei]
MCRLKEIIQNFKNRELPDIGNLFSEELKFDVEDRVTSYFHLANEIITHNGMRDLFLGDNGSKRKCKVLMKHLPGSLQKTANGEAKTCVTKLYAVVNNLALEPEKEIRVVKRMNPNQQSRARVLAQRAPPRCSARSQLLRLGLSLVENGARTLNQKRAPRERSPVLPIPNSVFIVKENMNLTTTPPRPRQIKQQSEKKKSGISVSKPIWVPAKETWLDYVVSANVCLKAAPCYWKVC